MYTIYALVDPRTRQIRYIGQTSRHPTVRSEDHWSNEDEHNKRKRDWIQELKLLNAKPSVVALQYVNSANEANKSERYWITLGLRYNWPLVNGTTPASYNDAQKRAKKKAATKPAFCTWSIWYEYIFAYMNTSHGAGLWQSPARGVRALARAMSRHATGSEAAEDGYVSIASKVAADIRATSSAPHA